MSSLRELEERRAFECRLTADRALQSLDEENGPMVAINRKLGYRQIVRETNYER